MNSLPLVASSLLCTLLPAQVRPAAGAQPGKLELGTLRQGTHVEGNVLIWWQDGKRERTVDKLVAPAFVKVVRTENPRDEQHGAYSRLYFTVDTTQVGAVEGTISVSSRGTTVAVPVSAVVLPGSPVSTRVLVLNTPFDGTSTKDSRDFAAWRRVVDAGKLEVHYLNADDKVAHLPLDVLQRVDVVLVGQAGLLQLSETDAAHLRGFAAGGGRLVVAAGQFFRGTVGKANELLKPFGMEMDDEEPTGLARFVTEDGDIAKHPLTHKVTQVSLRRPTPTRIVDPKRARRLIAVFPERAFVALAETGSGGEVIALGAPLWWLWLAEDPGNERFMRNLLTRPRRPR